MIKMDTNGGLCMTCNNAPTCFYRATRGPGLFCEMFDDYVAPGVQAVVRGGPDHSGSARVTGSATGEGAVFTGLCMNCDHRLVCEHAKAEGGVWHGEQYE